METQTLESGQNPSGINHYRIVNPEIPVLNISGISNRPPSKSRQRGIKKEVPVKPEPPRINTSTLPSFLSKILLRTNDPPKDGNCSQQLCILSFEKPATRKRICHMFISDENHLHRDYQRNEKLYKNREKFKNGTNITVDAPCSRSLYRKVQNKFIDVAWNEQGNVFETNMVKDSDVNLILDRVYELREEELERLINYIKFMAKTKT